MTGDPANNPQLADTQPPSKEQQNLTVGKPLKPLAIQIPLHTFIVCLLVAISTGLAFYWESGELIRDKEHYELEHEAELLAAPILQFFDQPQQDLWFISNVHSSHQIARHYLNQSLNQSARNQADAQPSLEYQRWRDQVTVTFTRLIQSRPFYDQLRLISVDSGDELIRVERQRNQKGDQIRVAPEAQLQNKNSRDYVEQGRNLLPQQIYISPINLNRENGVIEVPHKPVLRFVSLLRHPDTNKPALLVVINSSFSRFTAELESLSHKTIDLILANPAGDYLIHPNERTFGFDLAGRPSSPEPHYCSCQEQ